MIEDNIHIDAHASIIAAPDHAGELLLVARTCGELVGDGLVALPPGTRANHSVLIDRRDLGEWTDVSSSYLLL